MKAEAPRAPIVKFGMATDESERMVERHFEVMDERDQIAAGVYDHNLRTACIAKALLDGRSDPEPLPTPMPTALPVAPVDVPLDNVRSQLGLS